MSDNTMTDDDLNDLVHTVADFIEDRTDLPEPLDRIAINDLLSGYLSSNGVEVVETESGVSQREGRLSD